MTKNPDIDSVPPLSLARLTALLRAMGQLRVLVVGDVALDVYWIADMTRSRLARENPHYYLPVVEERLSPGAGGNVAANVAALGVADVTLVTMLGQDWRGDVMRGLFTRLGVSTRGLCASPAWITNMYCKPVRKGYGELLVEDPHIYYENTVALPEADEQRLLEQLELALEQADVVVVADYMRCGVITEAVCARLCAAGQAGKTVVVDSRDHIASYHDVLLKPNEVELAQALGWETPPLDDLKSFATGAVAFAQQRNARLCLTLGSLGSIWYDEGQLVRVSTHPAPPPIDIVGSGDCFASALSAALAAGATGPEAAQLANLAAGVVVRKLGTTGTATPEEIVARFQEES